MAIAGIKFKHANMYLHVWVGIDGDGLLRVVLADVHEHLVRRQAVAILHDGHKVGNNVISCNLLDGRQQVVRVKAGCVYLVVAKQPHLGRLVVLVIGDGDIVRARLQDQVRILGLLRQCRLCVLWQHRH